VEQSSVGVLGISLVVWDCGLYLVDYLCSLSSRVGDDGNAHLGTCLDLGCGTGVVGLAALLLGASKCVFTDKVVSSCLRANIDSLPTESSRLAEVVEFDWTSTEGIPERLITQHWDTLLASDILYESSLHDCILKIIRQLVFKKFILAYKRRHDDMERKFFSCLEADFTVSVIPEVLVRSMNLPTSSVAGLYILCISPLVKL
jgi:predicted nicotinamide N-methyase